MSEILTMHRHFDERLSTQNDIRIGRVLWSCDGHECPSYIASLATRITLPPMIEETSVFA